MLDSYTNPFSSYLFIVITHTIIQQPALILCSSLGGRYWSDTLTEWPLRWAFTVCCREQRGHSLHIKYQLCTRCNIIKSVPRGLFLPHRVFHHSHASVSGAFHTSGSTFGRKKKTNSWKEGDDSCRFCMRAEQPLAAQNLITVPT